MQPIRKHMRQNIVVVMILLMNLLSVRVSGQSNGGGAGGGSGGGNGDGQKYVEVNIDAHQCGSDDTAKVGFQVNDGQHWKPDAARDNCARGAAGTHTFKLKTGKTYTLNVTPGKAISPPDGNVSLWWNLWADDAVLINGQTTTYNTPISGGGHPMPESEYTIQTPHMVNAVFSFDDGPHSASLSGDNYTMEVLQELSANSVQSGSKAMWCIQTHVSHRGGNAIGQAVIQEQWNQGHIVAIHTGSDDDHIDH